MYTLTKEDIKAIRKSNNIYAYVKRDGTSTLEAARRDQRTNDGATISYPRHIMPVDSRFELYRDKTNQPDGCSSPVYQDELKVYRAFGDAYTSYGTGAAIKYLLREGDNITLKWTGGDFHGYLFNLRCNHPDYKDQRLYHDRVYIEVQRGKDQEFSLLLDDSICPNNNARMIEYTITES